MALSDKAVINNGIDSSNNPIPRYYWEKDVKAFIEEILRFVSPEKGNGIKKLAGDKLI